MHPKEVPRKAGVKAICEGSMPRSMDICVQTRQSVYYCNIPVRSYKLIAWRVWVGARAPMTPAVTHLPDNPPGDVVRAALSEEAMRTDLLHRPTAILARRLAGRPRRTQLASCMDRSAS